jgi:CAAX prenyl protease-like protein
MMPTDRRSLLAYTLPFALFMTGLVAVSAAKGLGITSFAGISLDPMYWIYPIQTAVCAVALLWFWSCYDVGVTNWGMILIGVVAGLIIFGLWVAPQEFFHQPRRTEGFDPGVMPGMTHWMTLARFTRLVIIVPLVEEIFWRGFLLRYLMREDFTALPFGSSSRFSFWAVVVAFTLVHAPSDWPAASLTGILLNVVAIRTRSLFACIAAHATANLVLGIYICETRQWGFW